jgi:recombination protein RecT
MTAVATVPTPELKGIAATLGNPAALARITPFLPEGVNVERVIAAAQLAVMKLPAIGECEPKSIVLAVAKIAQWGLEIGDTAHLVPFGKECTPVPDYRGLVEMIVRSGAARGVEARVVRQGDEFAYAYGTEKYIRHTPLAKSTAPITHAYAIANLRFQSFDFVVLDVEEIEAVRAKSKQWSKGALPAWYAKKTAVRRVVNLIPKNAKLASVLRTVEEVEAGEFTVLPPDRDPDGPTPAQIAAATGDLRGNGQSRFPSPVQHGDYPVDAEATDGFDPNTGDVL